MTRFVVSRKPLSLSNRRSGVLKRAAGEYASCPPPLLVFACLVAAQANPRTGLPSSTVSGYPHDAKRSNRNNNTDTAMAPKAGRRQASAAAFDSFRVSKASLAKSKNSKNTKVPPAITKDSISKAEVQSSDLPVPVLSHSESSSVSLPEAAEEEPKPLLPALDEKDPAYVALASEINALRKTPQIHNQKTTIETILQDFDLTGKYGPCVGITRLERFRRAQKWGLNPPAEIGKILESQEGEDDVNYKHDLFYGRL